MANEKHAASEVNATACTGKTVDVTLHITAKDLWACSIQVPACGLCIDLYRLAAMSALAQGKQTGKASGCKKSNAADVRSGEADG